VKGIAKFCDNVFGQKEKTQQQNKQKIVAAGN